MGFNSGLKGLTWQGVDYKLLENDTIVSKHIGV
jgi:hypothetical protein